MTELQEMKMRRIKDLLEILMVSTRLGLSSFGGRTAHLGSYQEGYVRRKKTMDETACADRVALAQFLPGPASSQVGIGIGLMRGGVLGGVTSFLGFTLPSVIVLIAFALVLTSFNVADAGWIQGLKIVAVAVVAHAVLGMAKKLAPDLKRKAIVLFALIGTLVWQTAFTQVGVILIAALVGFLIY